MWRALRPCPPLPKSRIGQRHPRGSSRRRRDGSTIRDPKVLKTSPVARDCAPSPPPRAIATATAIAIETTCLLRPLRSARGGREVPLAPGYTSAQTPPTSMRKSTLRNFSAPKQALKCSPRLAGELWGQGRLTPTPWLHGGARYTRGSDTDPTDGGTVRTAVRVV